MIGPGSNVRVYLACGVTDMRKGIDGLAALVQSGLRQKRCSPSAVAAATIGRKNWLFAGSDKGGERAAGILSLIETAKLNGIDQEAYLRTVLTKIADHPITRIDELLPWKLEISPTAA